MDGSFIERMVPKGGERMKHKVVGLLLCGLVGWAVPGAAWADGAVYAMTNALGNNEIKVYHRANDGTLTLIQTIATRGGGSGIQLDPTDSLGSQGGLVLDRRHHRLFAVNTESFAEDLREDPTDIGDCHKGTISSFRVAEDGSLTLVDQIPSGGLFPASLAVRGDRLYVLNAGGPGLNPVCGIGPNITGFHVRPNAEMRLLADSTQPINPGSSPGSFLNCDPGVGPFPTDEFRCGLNPPAFPRGPAQIGFTPDGRALVVTVKGTNSIYVFPVDKAGLPGAPKITQVGGPNQPTPFGFAFDGRGHLIVTEPFGATPTIPAVPFSAVSSFAINEDGTLEAISSSVPNGRGTSCWIALDPSSRYAYIGNNATSDISSYRIGKNGSLTLLEAVAAPANLPNDLAVAQDNGKSFLYVLNSGNGTVGAFRIEDDGSLTPLGAVDGLPADAGAQGLAAY
jgi:6-phosphogluconolactonase (cycloisomerase 2 family)